MAGVGKRSVDADADEEGRVSMTVHAGRTPVLQYRFSEHGTFLGVLDMYWSWQLSMNLTIADPVSDSRFGFITTAMPRLRPDGRKSWDGNRIGVSKLHSVTDRLNFYDVSPTDAVTFVRPAGGPSSAFRLEK